MVASATSPLNCNQACTMDYRPVCGMLPNGKMQTFGNQCALDVENCRNQGLADSKHFFVCFYA